MSFQLSECTLASATAGGRWTRACRKTEAYSSGRPLKAPEAHAASDLFAQLNPQQRAAAEHDHDLPLLIIAGAGSGKTKTLAHRVAHLIAQGADPRAIAPSVQQLEDRGQLPAARADRWAVGCHDALYADPLPARECPRAGDRPRHHRGFGRSRRDHSRPGWRARSRAPRDLLGWLVPDRDVGLLRKLRSMMAVGCSHFSH